MRASTIVMIGFAVVFGLLAVFIAQAWLNNQAEHAQRRISKRRSNAGGDADHRRRQAAAALRHRAQRGDAAGSAVAGRCGAGRRLRQDRRRARQAAAASCWPRSSRTSRCSRSRSPAPASARRSRRWSRRHEGRDHPRQRRRRRRRLRAAGRSRRRRAHAPASTRARPTTEVVLQNARVLAVDQIADERADKPSVAKAVTLEVDTVEAQKIGSPLRSARCRCCCARPARQPKRQTRRITLSDLGDRRAERRPTKRYRDGRRSRAQRAKQEYNVPVEGTDGAVGRQRKREAVGPQRDELGE